MLAYVLRRLFAAIPILIGIAIISFIVILLNTCSWDFQPLQPLDRLLRHFF
jgi:ABC-type microcin C transport system permease subunit YejB